MDIYTLGNPTEVPPNFFPFYVKNEAEKPDEEVVSFDLNELAQGPGSGLDSDTTDGFQAVSAAKYGPNKLVATDETGKLPIGIIPVLAGTSAVIGATGTYAALKAAPLAGLYFAWATDLGLGTLVFYTANASIGDNGWLLVGGG